MANWFEGSNEIKCGIQRFKDSFKNLGDHCVGVVKLFPGMTSVDLLDEGSDFVTIRTNEGLMKRTSISKTVNDWECNVEVVQAVLGGVMGWKDVTMLRKYTAAVESELAQPATQIFSSRPTRSIENLSNAPPENWLSQEHKDEQICVFSRCWLF